MAALALGLAACGGTAVTTPIAAPSPAAPAPVLVGGAAPPVESSSAIQHTIGDQRFSVTNAQGTGTIPLFASAPLGSPHAGVVRVVVIVHGETRDAGEYFNDVTAAASEAGPAGASALVVAPQFLNIEDVLDPRNALPATILGWHVDEYSDGKDAVAPAPISTFDVLDALVASFTNRALYPNLQTIVVAGHSGGGQLIGRYAIVGTGYAAAIAAGYSVRFVIASPSSFLYFDGLRPAPAAGTFAVPADAASCSSYNAWRYGFGSPPRYVGTPDVPALWTHYEAQNVTYLAGSLDTDATGSIDQSCGAEDEGSQRLDRAVKYYAYLTVRNGGVPLGSTTTVNGVGHSDYDMLTSAPAVAAMFGP